MNMKYNDKTVMHACMHDIRELQYILFQKVMHKCPMQIFIISIHLVTPQYLAFQVRFNFYNCVQVMEDAVN